MSQIIRRHLIFSGRVQGVAFRYRAMHICNAMGLTGWVRNCWDDRVEMEVQGKPEQIEQMISTIGAQTYIEIDRVDGETIPCEEHENSFEIRDW